MKTHDLGRALECRMYQRVDVDCGVRYGQVPTVLRYYDYPITLNFHLGKLIGAWSLDSRLLMLHLGFAFCRNRSYLSGKCNLKLWRLQDRKEQKPLLF